MKLPLPSESGGIALERAIKNRRTVRAFTSEGLSIEQLTQLLWSAQGITEDKGFKRAAPSGGALFPMDVYAALGESAAQDLKAGVYHYEPRAHAVSLVFEGDQRQALAQASYFQQWMAEAPLNLIITAEYNRINIKYGQRGVRYAIMESGHIAQNIFLMAESLGLGAGIVGAFDDERVARVLGVPSSHEPLLIMPVGFKRRR